MKKVVVINPIITEKSMMLAQDATYTFRVLKSANSIEVAKAIEQIYKVKVADVNISNTTGKTKRTGKIFGKRADWKKAYVKLEKGQKIKEFQIEEDKPKKEKEDKPKTVKNKSTESKQG